MKQGLFVIVALLLASFLSAQDIRLVPPTKTGGKPLMEVLNERKSSRNFVKKDLPDNILSDLLWSAYGFNREDKRTVPSSMNLQVMDVYVMFDNAVYFYDAKQNILKEHVKGDLRKGLGSQDYVYDAAINLIYVSKKKGTGYIDTGYISQNVYLYSASAGLGTVARTSFNRETLPTSMKLGDNEEIIMVQAVGYTE